MRTLELGTIRRQGCYQPGVPEHGGMQVVREMTDVLRERVRALLKRSQIVVQIVADLQFRQSLLQAAECDRQAGQLLAHVVVQVARDARALRIPGLDQPAGQLLDLLMAHLERGAALADPLFRILAFGDIDAAADVTRERAIGCVFRNSVIQDPAVDAVGCANSVLHEEWPARLERRHVGSGALLDIVGMDQVQPAFVR